MILVVVVDNHSCCCSRVDALFARMHDHLKEREDCNNVTIE